MTRRMNSLSSTPLPEGPSIAKTPLDRLRIGRHQFELRPAVAGKACDWRRFGLRHRCSAICDAHCQLHRRFEKPRNWHRPERCQFLATEVSRDFVPPCPRADFSRAGGGSWTSHRTGCGTLATNSMTKAGAKDMPDLARLYRPVVPRNFGAIRFGVSGHALGDCGRNRPLRLIITCQKCEVCFAMAGDFARCAVMSFFGVAVFEACCTVCSRSTGPLIPAVQSGAALASPRSETRSHNPLHHGNESLLVCLAQIGQGLKVSGARRPLHSPQQRRAPTW